MEWQQIDVRDYWREDPAGDRLMELLRSPGDDVPAISLPDDAALLDALRLFDVPAETHAEILHLRDLVGQREDTRWLLDHHVALLREWMDTYTREVQFLGLSLSSGDFGRFFYLIVYAAMLPYSLEHLASRHIPEPIVASTFADVGSKMRVQHRRFGQLGLWIPSWLIRHFRGMIYQLGRLQFERSQLPEPLVESVRAAGFDYQAGEPVLALHIPDFMGPMSPAACDDSFRQAREFFPQYFPEMPLEIAFCNSWLLDTQLPDHLPAATNIVQFQQRFVIPVQAERDDSSVATFVWGRDSMPDVVTDESTSLERALIAHRQNGGHWGSGLGWLRLP